MSLNHRCGKDITVDRIMAWAESAGLTATRQSTGVVQLGAPERNIEAVIDDLGLSIRSEMLCDSFSQSPSLAGLINSINARPDRPAVTVCPSSGNLLIRTLFPADRKGPGLLGQTLRAGDGMLAGFLGTAVTSVAATAAKLSAHADVAAGMPAFGPRESYLITELPEPPSTVTVEAIAESLSAAYPGGVEVTAGGSIVVDTPGFRQIVVDATCLPDWVAATYTPGGAAFTPGNHPDYWEALRSTFSFGLAPYAAIDTGGMMVPGFRCSLICTAAGDHAPAKIRALVGYLAQADR